MKINSAFLKLELEDKRILYIAKDDISRIIYDPKENRYAIFTKFLISNSDLEDPEYFSEAKERKAYTTIKNYLAITT